MNSSLAADIRAVFAEAKEANERAIRANEGGYNGEGMLSMLEPNIKAVLVKHGVVE